MKRLIRFIDQKGVSVLVLILSDAFWYFISLLTAYFIRNRAWPTRIQEINVYLQAAPAILLLLIIVFYSYGLYEQKNRINKISEMYLLTKALTVSLILIMAASFMRKYEYSRALIILLWILSLFYLNFGRFLVRTIKNRLLKAEIGLINVLIIGAGKPGRKIATTLEEYRDFGYQVRGFLDDTIKSPTNLSAKFLGKTGEILKVIKQKEINLVFIADPSLAHVEILNLMQRCAHTKVKFKVVSDLFEIVAGGMDINEIEEIPSLDFQKNTKSIFYRLIKRLMDIVLAGVGIIVLAPFVVFLAILIKSSSKGSIFFTQERVGKDGQIFQIWKFRSMYQEVEKQAFSPHHESDERITKIGRFLRKTSLDELPQLWNILKGEMSIVGPRPEMPFIVAKYKNWQKRRLAVKPGLTGLWQVLGRKDLPLLENIEYDFYYIQNQSILLDLVIIFKTFSALISRRGAY